MRPALRPRVAGGGQVQATGQGWRLHIPAGGDRTYRLAQLDDYAGLPRRAFPHRAPARLQVRLRVTHPQAAGTWGIGWWNDPFGVGLGYGGGLRLPVCPQAGWFFFAAPANYLAFHPTRTPARGFFAGVTRGCGASPLWLALPGLLALPLLWWPRVSDALRRLVAPCLQQAGVALTADPTRWHTYTLHWETEQMDFWLDGERVARLPLSPRGPLGFVLWVDNQYAAWPPGERPRWGLLPTPRPVTLEVAAIVWDGA